MVVEADPGGGDQLAVESRKPGIFRLVGGAGFPGDIAAAQLLGGSPTRSHPTCIHAAIPSTEDGAVHGFGDQKGIGMADDLRCQIRGDIQRDLTVGAALCATGRIVGGGGLRQLIGAGVTGTLGFGFIEDVALRILYSGDEIGFDFESTVGDGGVAGDHLHG